MKTIFDREAHDELQRRLEMISADSKREWGKMSPSQAMEHCARALDVAIGRTEMKQALIGKLFSRFAWKKFMGEAPMPKNSLTGPTLIVKGEPDFDTTLMRLRECITALHEAGEPGAEGRIHGFFGRLSGKQWGELQYKHVDHHLKQFGL